MKTRRSFFRNILGSCAALVGIKAVPTAKLQPTWAEMAQAEIAARRADPFAIYSMPFPVSYQEL